MSSDMSISSASTPPADPASTTRNQEAESSSGRKRKRSLDKSNPNPGSPEPESSRPRSPDPRNAKKPRTRFVRRPKKPKKPNDWHLKRGEVPNEATKTKLALELHIRTLWRLPTQNAVPPVVTDIDKAILTRHFSSEAQVKSTVTAALDSNEAYIQSHATTRELYALLQDDSSISNNIKRIQESYLLLMFRTVASPGLQKWAPDVRGGDPDSLYNLLHEHTALTTFEQVSASYGYSFTGINLAFVRDFPLMRKIYRSFVFSYMHDIAKLEAKSPGGVAESKRIGNVYKRRQELMTSRVDIFKAQGFNRRVIALAQETEAHSDDELAEPQVGAGATSSANAAASHPGPVYHIKDKDGRSAKVKKFFRMADDLRLRIARARRKRQRSERRREDSPTLQVSAFTTRPKQVPIDWFDPFHWNNYLTVRERADYIADGIRIALPLEEFCTTWEQCAKWKNLPEEQFMRTYGVAVLQQYNMPTDEELEQLERYGEDAENDGDRDDGYYGDDDHNGDDGYDGGDGDNGDNDGGED